MQQYIMFGFVEDRSFIEVPVCKGKDEAAIYIILYISAFAWVKKVEKL